MWEEQLVILMLTVDQVLNVGGNTLSKAAMAKGMSNFVYITYAHALAFLLLLPSAFLFHWKNAPPSITYSIILRLFLLGFICYCCSIFLFIGIRYSSPTLASAMHNLAPAFTFMFAIIFRMEALKIRSKSSYLKIMGTLVSVSGALIVIFYQGLPVIVLQSSPSESTIHSLLASQEPNWIIGGFLLFTSSVFLSLIYIVKTWIVRDFPSDVLVTLIFFFFEIIIALLVALCVERDTSAWMPTFDIEMIAIVAGGIVFSVINTIHTWACRKKGPVFTAMFNPLQMIVSVIVGILFLGDTLYLGSVIGGVVIALGFYSVLKGKTEDQVLLTEGGQDGKLSTYNSESSSHTAPLLPTKT